VNTPTTYLEDGSFGHICDLAFDWFDLDLCFVNALVDDIARIFDRLLLGTDPSCDIIDIGDLDMSQSRMSWTYSSTQGNNPDAWILSLHT